MFFQIGVLAFNNLFCKQQLFMTAFKELLTDHVEIYSFESIEIF